jgi:hypothetical protein
MEIGFGVILTENGSHIGMVWRDFIVFLHKEGVYKEYRNEFNKYCIRNFVPIQDHIEYVKNTYDGFFVASSFHWDKTNNGIMFWTNISRKWNSYKDELA